MHAVALDIFEDFPTSHKVQFSDLLLEYEPIPHSVQLTDSKFACQPASQPMQVVAPIATPSVDEPGTQEIHLDVVAVGV